jgi:hypothetical protein
MESRVYGSLLEKVSTTLKIACLHAPSQTSVARTQQTQMA